MASLHLLDLFEHIKAFSKVNVNLKNDSLHVFSNGREAHKCTINKFQGFLSLSFPVASEQVKGLEILIPVSNLVSIRALNIYCCLGVLHFGNL